MREAMHKRLYKESPGLARDEESGKMNVKKGVTEGERETSTVDAGIAGVPIHTHQANERGEMKHRHVKEHLDMHHRHNVEHAHQENGDGDKAKLHEKHERELKEMHTRHEKEHKSMHDRHEKEGHGVGKSGGTAKPKEEKKESKGSGDGEEKIKKVDKGEE